MVDISASGSSLNITSAVTGSFDIHRFPDDSTPFEFSEMEVTGSAVSINGELIVWKKPTAFACSISVLPGTEEDQYLNRLLNFSRTKFGGGVSVDIGRPATLVTLVAVIPVTCDIYSKPTIGTHVFTFLNGCIVSGPSAPSVQSDGRKTTRTYSFIFETMEVVKNDAPAVFSSKFF